VQGGYREVSSHEAAWLIFANHMRERLYHIGTIIVIIALIVLVGLILVGGAGWLLKIGLPGYWDWVMVLIISVLLILIMYRFKKKFLAKKGDHSRS